MSVSESINDMRKKISDTNSLTKNEALRNPWVLTILGIVVTFVTVNIVFIIVAFVTSPGLVVENYYEAGRAYEKNALKMLAATQSTRNWETKLDMTQDVFINKENAIRFTAVDERGLPIADASVQLVAYRPSDAEEDIITPMKEIAPGLFEAVVTFPLKGIWDVNVKVQQENSKFELARRISVKM